MNIANLKIGGAAWSRIRAGADAAGGGGHARH